MLLVNQDRLPEIFVNSIKHGNTTDITNKGVPIFALYDQIRAKFSWYEYGEESWLFHGISGNAFCRLRWSISNLFAHKLLGQAGFVSAKYGWDKRAFIDIDQVFSIFSRPYFLSFLLCSSTDHDGILCTYDVLSCTSCLLNDTNYYSC